MSYPDPGIVYVIVNEAMPGLVKIGLTRGDLERRLKELDNTAVPMPFDVHHASYVADVARAERLIHRAFSSFRVRTNREFFAMDPEQATAALLLVEVKDVTDDAQADAISALDSEEDRTNLEMKRRRSANFEAADIPVGSILQYTRNGEIEAKVVSERLVEYENEEYSLSALTAHLMKTLEGKHGSYNGWEYWSYEGVKLATLWKDISSEFVDTDSPSEWGLKTNEFLQEAIDRITTSGSPILRGRTAKYDGWLGLGAGVSGLNYHINIKRKVLSIDIYMNVGNKEDNLLYFDALHAHKEEIENSFGNALIWARDDSDRTCRIYTEIDFDIDNKTKWEESLSWLVTGFPKLRSSINPVLKEIKKSI